jgi:hypothetical protein
MGAPVGSGVIATIVGNAIRAGGAQTSIGVAALGTAPGAVLARNVISTSGSSAYGAWGIVASSPIGIDANRINADPNAAPATCPASVWCGGISITSTTALVTNNVVFGPRGVARSAALFLQESERPTGVVVVNGNLLDGGGEAMVPGGAPTLSAAVGLRIGACDTCGLTGLVGRLRNNILVGGAGAARLAVHEEAPLRRTIHPEVFEHNALHAGKSGSGNGDVLYRAWNGMTVVNLVSMAEIAAQVPWKSPAVNNLNVDPMVDTTGHLMKGSPLIDKGTSTEAPHRDLDDEPRPRGAAMDIGADEAL